MLAFFNLRATQRTLAHPYVTSDCLLELLGWEKWGQMKKQGWGMA
jgi:hypothetical protein